MSWLARSLTNSLRLQNDDESSEDDVAPSVKPNRDEKVPEERENNSSESIDEEGAIGEDEEAQARGVKEDLTELRQTLTRQIWGVANFLAPPPDQGSDGPDRSGDEGEPSDSEAPIDQLLLGSEVGTAGEDNAEEEGYRGGGAVGITEEVLAFARNIAMHPETWLDFPLDEEDDLDDFDMSDAQQDHAFTIEQLAPRLAALRIELCPCHMKESYFWKVYFVLLHSRLHKHDAELLSTPQVMEARAMWMQELHKKTDSEDEWFGTSTSYVRDSSSPLYQDHGHWKTFNYDRATEYEIEKHPIASSSEVQCVDKSVIEEKPVIKTKPKELLVGPSSKILLDLEDDDGWLEEDSDVGSCYKATFPTGNEEDFSFSDLEDDACSTLPSKSEALSTGAKR